MWGKEQASSFLFIIYDIRAQNKQLGQGGGEKGVWEWNGKDGQSAKLEVSAQSWKWFDLNGDETICEYGMPKLEIALHEICMYIQQTDH